MIDIGVHMIEAAHYLMGSPQPVSAFGSAYTYLGDRTSDTVSMWPDWDHETYSVEDLAVGMIRFDNGATLSVEASFAAHIGKGRMDLLPHGRKGRGPVQSAHGLQGSVRNHGQHDAGLRAEHERFPVTSCATSWTACRPVIRPRRPVNTASSCSRS